MSRWSLTQADSGDLVEVVGLLNEAAARLHAAGIDQWGLDWMSRERMSPAVDRGEVYVVREHSGRSIATIQLSPRADPDFWMEAEQQDSALYVGKLARGTEAPRGVGTALLCWSVHHAASRGYELVRLDAWASNSGLHNFYLNKGWRHVRTCIVSGRQSGALFEVEAKKNAEVASLFEELASGGRRCAQEPTVSARSAPRCGG